MLFRAPHKTQACALKAIRVVFHRDDVEYGRVTSSQTLPHIRHRYERAYIVARLLSSARRSSDDISVSKNAIRSFKSFRFETDMSLAKSIKQVVRKSRDHTYTAKRQRLVHAV